MPTRGDKMYRNFNGTLDVCTFLEEGLSAPACTVTTYLMRDRDGRQFRCATDMYVPTELAAWQHYLDDCREAVPAIEQRILTAAEQLQHVKAEIARAEKLMLHLAAIASPAPT